MIIVRTAPLLLISSTLRKAINSAKMCFANSPLCKKKIATWINRTLRLVIVIGLRKQAVHCVPSRNFAFACICVGFLPVMRMGTGEIQEMRERKCPKDLENWYGAAALFLRWQLGR